MNMKENPLVSVVLAVHRDSPFLKAAIASLIDQSLKNIEIIIIANGCSDDFFARLQQFNDSRIRVERLEIGQLASSLNYGIGLSKAKLVARMDHDDISHPDRLKIQYEQFLADPNLDILGTSLELIDETGRIIGINTPPLSNISIRNSLPFKNPLNHPTVMLKREVVLKNSGYSGGLVSEDYGFWLRLSRPEKFLLVQLHI